MKYIRFKAIGFVVFPSAIQHDNVSASFAPDQPVSAGSVFATGGEITCSGDSVTLGIESQESDTWDLMEQLSKASG